MIHKLLLALLVSFCVLSAGRGQDAKPQAPPPTQTPSPSQKPTPDDKDDVVRITTNLVQVDVAVTKGGKPVKDLKPLPESADIFPRLESIAGRIDPATRLWRLSASREAV